MLRSASVLAVLLLASCGGPDPTLRVDPAAGTQAGGQRLRIEGADFLGHGALVVYVGQRAAKGVVIHGPTLIEVTTPESETVGPVDLVLRFSDGTEQRLEEGYSLEEQPGFIMRPRIGEG